MSSMGFSKFGWITEQRTWGFWVRNVSRKLRNSIELCYNRLDTLIPFVAFSAPSLDVNELGA